MFRHSPPLLDDPPTPLTREEYEARHKELTERIYRLEEGEIRLTVLLIVVAFFSGSTFILHFI